MNESGNSAGEDASWTTETLPLSVRKELLERELRKLGFRKAGAGASSHPGGSMQQQQQQQPQPSSHPCADGGDGGHSD